MCWITISVSDHGDDDDDDDGDYYDNDVDDDADDNDDEYSDIHVHFLSFCTIQLCEALLHDKSLRLHIQGEIESQMWLAGG